MEVSQREESGNCSSINGLEKDAYGVGGCLASKLKRAERHSSLQVICWYPDVTFYGV